MIKNLNTCELLPNFRNDKKVKRGNEMKFFPTLYKTMVKTSLGYSIKSFSL